MGPQATISEIAAWLKRRDDLIVIGHVSPDGDAVGSVLAVTLALQALGKRAVACLPGPVPGLYRPFPGWEQILEAGQALPFAPRTGLSLDVAEKRRMGGAEAIYDACPDRAMMDHHATNEGFGQIWRVEGECAAAGEMALRLIRELGVELTQQIATWLYIAISTDTGRFRFSNTTPETFRAAAELRAAGADVAEISRLVWHTRSLPRTRLLARVLDGLQVSGDGRMAWARLTNGMLAECGARREDSEDIVNYLLEIEGVEFAALAEEREGETKFSLRSKQWLDVAACVARPFDGGGHSRAAGCALPQPMDEALPKVLEKAAEAMSKEDAERP